VDTPVAELLASYHEKVDEVWVELGLQSAHDETLHSIGRGHSVEQFAAAFGLLRTHGLKVAAHLIMGLPGEDHAMMMDTVGYLAALRPDGVKLHNLHVRRGAPLASDFLTGEIAVPCMERHLGIVTEALSILPEDTVIMRMLCDTPSGDLLAPKPTMSKARFHDLVGAGARPR
jgi:radical SAM protein (TIGR01212 family)